MPFFTGLLHYTIIAYIRRTIQIFAEAGLIILADFGASVSVAEFAAAETRMFLFGTKVFMQALTIVGTVIFSACYAIDEHSVIPDFP